MNKKIYLHNITRLLMELADKEYQVAVWHRAGRKQGMSISFIEAANMLFDDCVIGDYLKENQIIISKQITQALRELESTIAAIDEFRPEEEVINDPLMNIVRTKATEILRLIANTDGSESTVELVG